MTGIIKRKTSNIPVSYMVYYHKGHIKIRAGKKLGVFYPFETDTYMTKNPDEPMQINNRGKVWCLHQADISAAMMMIHDAYKDKLIEYREISGAQIRNFERITGE